jgi:outer membrane receptor protein involved in Fe transport
MKHETSATVVAFLVVVTLLLMLGGRVLAGEERHIDLSEMSIEELMNVPVVVSASRQAQKIGELSAPVSVITAEDIHSSGLTMIPEIIQFAAGSSVMRINRARYALGVRGLHERITDRVLILIDGRPADSPLFGGPESTLMPILVEDIDRIEIVRGPGGAVWGANAFTGVINIITKRPKAVPGHFLSSTVTQFGDTYTHGRWADTIGRLSWRLSLGYEDLKSSDDAGAGDYVISNPAVAPLIGFDSYVADDDFLRRGIVDGDATWEYSGFTKFSFGLAYAHEDSGTFEFGGFRPEGDARYRRGRAYAKVDHELANGSAASLQWAGRFNTTVEKSITEWQTIENYIEGEWRTRLSDKNSLLAGVDLRLVQFDMTKNSRFDVDYPGEPYDEQMAGGFLVDRWDMTDRLTFEAQGRGDWYSETQMDWAARGTAFYALDEAKNHTLRFSSAKAFRTPFVSTRRSIVHRIPLPVPPAPAPGLFAFNVIAPSEDLENEETWSGEFGYTGTLAKGLVLRGDAYYQRFEELIGYETVAQIGAISVFAPANIAGADSWGAELEAIWEGRRGKLSTWYAYNDFEPDRPDQKLRAYMPAKHNVGVGGRLYAGRGLSLNTNYRYTDTTRVAGETMMFDVPSSHRLDLGVAKQIINGKGELMVGIRDIVNGTDGPNFATGEFTAHETPGRTFFIRAQIGF